MIKEISKNSFATVEITDLSSEGMGIGRVNGMAVFVPKSAVGDKLKIKFTKVKSHHAFAIIDEIITPSLDRVLPDCSASRLCGGCVTRHITYQSETALKQKRVEETMRRIGGVEISANDILVSSPVRYRNKAQYPVRDGVLGFYAPHSHRCVPCNDCLLQPQEFTALCNEFKNFISEYRITSYNEETKKGLVRHFYIRKGFVTGEIQVVVVINGDTFPHIDMLCNRFKEICGDNLKSVVINKNTKNTNVILGDTCQTVYGNDYICDILCGVKVRLSPHSFYQVNHSAATLLYKKAGEYAKAKDAVVLDLYCGTGTIGLSMAKEAKQIIGVEIVEAAVLDAKVNAKENGIHNAEFICADATKAAQMLEKRNLKPDVVILDPPRKGCDKDLLYTVANNFSPERIVYVSCDVATLARDIKILGELGYAIKEYTPVDLFPRTAHVETVVMLSHKKPDSVINVKVEFGEGEGKVPLDNIAKRAEAYKPKERVTYKMIKEYIEEKYGFKVHTAYIAEVKRDLGLPMYDAPNAVEELKQPRKHPTPEKVEAIKDALKHFEVI